MPSARGFPYVDIEIGRDRLFSLNEPCQPIPFASRERVADDTAGVTRVEYESLNNEFIGQPPKAEDKKTLILTTLFPFDAANRSNSTFKVRYGIPCTYWPFASMVRSSYGQIVSINPSFLVHPSISGHP